MNTDSDHLTYAVFTGSARGEISEKLGAGHRLIWIPRVKPLPIGSGITELEQAVENDKNAWIIFSDPFSVDTVFDRSAGMFEVSESIHICALDETTAARLRSFYVHTDIIPRPNTVDAALGDIIRFSGESIGSIHYVCGSDSKGQLPTKVLPVNVYEPLFEDRTESTRIKILVAGGAADILVFSRADDVHNFELLFARDGAEQILSNSIVTADTEAAFKALSDRGVAVRYLDPKRLAPTSPQQDLK